MDFTTFASFPLRLDRPDLLDVVFTTKVMLSSNARVNQREIYNMLDLFGDLGGISSVIFPIIGVFLYRISEHSFNMKVIENLFTARTNQKDLFIKSNKVDKGNEILKKIRK